MSQRTTQQPYDEQRLLAAARAGDQSAVAELYLAQRTHGLGYALHQVRDVRLAEGIFSDAFCAALSAMRKGAGPRDNFALYLRTAIRHRAWKAAADARRLRVVEDVEVYILQHDHVPDHARTQSDIEDEVAHAFQLLPLRYRTVLHQRVLHGFTNRQSAAMLGITPAAEAQLYRRARLALKRRVGSPLR